MKKSIFSIFLLLALTNLFAQGSESKIEYRLDDKWEQDNPDFKWVKDYFVDEWGDDTQESFYHTIVFDQRFGYKIIICSQGIYFVIKDKMTFERLFVDETIKDHFTITTQDSNYSKTTGKLNWVENAKVFVPEKAIQENLMDSLFNTKFLKVLLENKKTKERYLFKIRCTEDLYLDFDYKGDMQ